MTKARDLIEAFKNEIAMQNYDEPLETTGEAGPDSDPDGKAQEILITPSEGADNAGVNPLASAEADIKAGDLVKKFEDAFDGASDSVSSPIGGDADTFNDPEFPSEKVENEDDQEGVDTTLAEASEFGCPSCGWTGPQPEIKVRQKGAGWICPNCQKPDVEKITEGFHFNTRIKQLEAYDHPVKVRLGLKECRRMTENLLNPEHPSPCPADDQSRKILESCSKRMTKIMEDMKQVQVQRRRRVQ